MTPASRPHKWRAPRLRAGADARDVASAILDAALVQARRNARGAAESPDPEFLHQMRVGLRRYRSALRVFRRFLRKGPRRQLASRARSAMRPLGVVRDWDVCAAWLAGAKAPAALVQRARLRREAARKALKPVDFAALEPRPTAWKPGSESMGSFRQRALPKARRKVIKRLRGLDWSDAGQRHRLRIDVKRLRYATDFLGGKAHALERLQDSLGDLNDLAVTRRLLEALQPPEGLLRRLASAERRLLALARRQVAALQAED